MKDHAELLAQEPDHLRRLRTAVTEAEAALGRRMVESESDLLCDGYAAHLRGINAARAALRKAEEEAKRPAWPTPEQIVATIQHAAVLDMASGRIRDRDTAMVYRAHRVALARVGTLPHHVVTVPSPSGGSITGEAVLIYDVQTLLSDIEALVREAQP